MDDLAAILAAGAATLETCNVMHRAADRTFRYLGPSLQHTWDFSHSIAYTSSRI